MTFAVASRTADTDAFTNTADIATALNASIGVSELSVLELASFCAKEETES